jgi:hypothetical protein
MSAGRLSVAILVGALGALQGTACSGCGEDAKGHAVHQKALVDLEALVDMVLDPRFDLAAAQRRLGPINRWVGGQAVCDSSDPARKEVVLETLHGALMGVQVQLATSIDVSWTDLRATFGEGEQGGRVLDLRNAPEVYVFSRKAPHPRGTLLLDVARVDGPTAHIVSMIIRRPEKK